MADFDAWYLPGLSADAISEWEYLERGAVRLRWPRLSAAHIAQICKFAVGQRRQQLAQLPVRHIVQALDAATVRLQAGIREHAALLAEVTGYSVPIVEETLTHM